MYWVYLLKSRKDNFLYTGSTPDLKNRLMKHQAGLVRSTKFHLPIELIYAELYKSKQDAANREYQLKKHAKAMGQLKRRIKFSLGFNTTKVWG